MIRLTKDGSIAYTQQPGWFADDIPHVALPLIAIGVSVNFGKCIVVGK